MPETGAMQSPRELGALAVHEPRESGIREAAARALGIWAWTQQVRGKQGGLEHEGLHAPEA